MLIDPYNLIKVIARLISIVCKYSNNKALISFDIKQNKDKINIHIYNKNKTKENITENEANVMETAAILCKLVLNLYGGKLEIKQRFNDVNIELQSVNNIDYTIRNGLELIKENDNMNTKIEEGNKVNESDLKDTETSKEVKDDKNDPVNHPSHYTDTKIEVMDYIEDKGFNFALGNAVKYISRAGKKDKNKTIQDLEKAEWYLNREIKRLKKLQGK